MKLFDVRYKECNLNSGILILRILISVLMAFYGYHKLVHFNEMVNSEFWKSNVDFLGLGSRVSIGLTIFAELFCSLFVIFGLFTRLSLIPLIFCMGYIVLVIDKSHFISSGDNGYEFSTAFIYLIIYIVLIITGPGKWSLDKLISDRKH